MKKRDIMQQTNINSELLESLDGDILHEDVVDVCSSYGEGACDRREFLRTLTLLGVSSASAYAAIGITDPHLAEAAEVKRGGTLRLGMPVQELTDPALFDWTEKSNIARLMVQYLTHTPGDNVTRPYLAVSWKPNRELTRWRFKLDKRAKWSNGEKLTAHDVKYTYEGFVAPDSKSSAKSLFSSLTKIEVVNDHEFVMHLSAPSLSIPENCYHYPCPIVPQGFYEKYDGNLKHPDLPVSGPYQLKEHKVGRRAVLEKRKDYWGDEGYLDAIHIFDLGTDFQASIAALASGQVDLLYQHTINELDLVEKLPNIQVIGGPSTQTIVMRMQTDTAPFDNLKLRQAIVAAVNNSLVKKFAYRDLATLGHNHHVSPEHPEYHKLPDLKRNVAKSKKLLTEAGYPKGVTLKISLGNTQGTFEQDAVQIVKEQLAEVGIRLKLNVLPTTQYWEIWDKAPFSLTYWAHRPLGTMVMELAYRSGVSWNESHYNNPDFDKALAKAISISDPKKRSKVMKELETYLQNDAIMIQPFFSQVFTSASNKVKGVEANPARYQELAWAWLEA